YKHRKETVERSFADAKQLHGHRYARFRGLAKVKAQALLAAACQNMKKMASLLEKALRLSLSSYLTQAKHLWRLWKALSLRLKNTWR
ncbi:transposase, partial [Undibacterium seohonense]